MSDYRICQCDIVDVQNKLFQILVEVDRICRKYNIKYSLEGGTLLGAIKYKGFVPWDDDIDIVMPRTDYERFLKICKKELDTQFFLQNSDIMYEFPLNYTKICLNNTLYIQGNSENFNIHHGLFLDVFPIDNVNLKLLKFQISIIRALSGTREYKINKRYKEDFKLPSSKKYKNLLCMVLSILPMEWINRLLYVTMTIFNYKKTDYVFELCTSSRNLKPLKRNVYEELIEVDFMGKSFLASKHYTRFLEARFGDISILPPIEKRVPSHNIIKCKL